MDSSVLRVAMWSGPRNISTAMMRSWENRGDTTVVDEPLYAHYLKVTGREHPGADEVIAAGPTDIQQAIAGLIGPVPGGKRIFYQKHMTHHLLPMIDRGWLAKVSNCFLIRDPREVIASFIKHVPDVTLADTGFEQQAEIFQRVCESTGQIPPVIDARDVLSNPRGVLSALCDRLEIEFTDRMLSWPPGLRDTDGIWAKYWYKEVQNTTSFQPYQPKSDRLPPRFQALAEESGRFYQQLYPHRISG